MEAKDVISTAKEYVASVFKDEGVFNIGLEEIEYNPLGTWEVTIGFSRPWDRKPYSVFSAAAGAPNDDTNIKRTYKTVEIDATTGKVKSVRNRVGMP